MCDRHESFLKGILKVHGILLILGLAQCEAQSLHEKKSDSDRTGFNLHLSGSFQLIFHLFHFVPVTLPKKSKEHENHHTKGENRNWPHPDYLPLLGAMPLLGGGGGRGERPTWGAMPLLHVAENQDAGKGVNVASKCSNRCQAMPLIAFQKQCVHNHKHGKTPYAQPKHKFPLALHVMLRGLKGQLDESVNRKVEAGSWENGNSGA